MTTIRKGLSPYRVRGGGVNTGGREQALVSNGYATALGVGDPIYVSNGIIRVAANVSAGADILTNPGRTYGVFLGCKYINADGQPVESTYFPAATSSGGRLENQTQVLGFYHPGFKGQTFLAVADASVSSLQNGALFSVSVGTPSAITKRSNTVVKTAVASAGVAHLVRIVGFPSIAGTAPDDAKTVVEVEFALV